MFILSHLFSIYSIAFSNLHYFFVLLLSFVFSSLTPSAILIVSSVDIVIVFNLVQFVLNSFIIIYGVCELLFWMICFNIFVLMFYSSSYFLFFRLSLSFTATMFQYRQTGNSRLRRWTFHNLWTQCPFNGLHPAYIFSGQLLIDCAYFATHARNAIESVTFTNHKTPRWDDEGADVTKTRIVLCEIKV